MPVLNLKNNQRVKDKVRLTTQRVRVFVFTPKGKVLPGFVFVGDMNETQISVYVERSIRTGSDLQIAFEHEGAQSYRGRGLICNRVSMSQGFIGTPALNFRATIQYAFSSEFERQQFLKFHQGLKDRFLFLSKLAAEANKKAA